MSGHTTLTPQTTKRIGAILQSTQNLTLGRLTLGRMNRNLAGGSQQSLTSLSKDSDGSSRLMMEKASLYIFVQPHVRSLKLDPSMKVELIPIEISDTRRLKNAFKKLMRACMPSGTNTGASSSFYKAVEDSEWLQGLQSLMQINDAVLDLMDIEKSSVMVCLEDGWDVTAQISSIAQLCMDPFYRTLKGFRVLVEKEWLALGHKFQHRSNLTIAGQDAAFAPIFLQFLDVVHQILNQFPMAFEFNDFYLRYLAYHHVSCRFNTFVFDNEKMRVQSGCPSGVSNASEVVDAKSEASDEDGLAHHPTATGSGVSTISADEAGVGIDVFDYIELAHAKSPIFFNFNYDPCQHPVLRPNSKLVDLKIWDYFYTEELNMGPVGYELDLSHYEGTFAADDVISGLVGRHCEESLIGSYDWIPGRNVPSAFDLLVQVAQLESQLGHLPKPWMHYWDMVSQMYVEQELPDEVYEESNLPMVMRSPSCNVTSSAALFHPHKPFTVEVLLRGRMGGRSSENNYTSQHKFERYYYTTLTTCDLCNGLLWGPKTGVRCTDCNYNCHHKCRENAPKTCSKQFSSSQLPSASDLDEQQYNLRNSARQTDSASMHGAESDDASNYQGFSASFEESSQIVYQGYLYKQVSVIIF